MVSANNEHGFELTAIKLFTILKHAIFLIRHSFCHARRRQIKSSGMNEPLARFCHVGVVYNEGEFVCRIANDHVP